MLLDPIRQYCERTSESLWAEPLNALSNAAFFIAAWVLWKQYKKIPPRPSPQPGEGEVRILIFFLFLIGCGSTLFHTFANRLTEIGDIIPIGIFTFYYLWVACRLLIGLRRRATLIALLAFIASAVMLSHASASWPDAYKFNGSIAYFPCLTALSLIGGILYSRRHPAARYVLQAVGVFVISLTFRSLDMHLCPSLPIGTHFLWHTLNGLVLYLLVRGVMTIFSRCAEP